MAEPPHPVLAVDRVRHVGDPVAVVIAETLGAGARRGRADRRRLRRRAGRRRSGRGAEAGRAAGLARRGAGQSLLRLASRRPGRGRCRDRQGGAGRQARPGQQPARPERDGAARRDRRIRPRHRRIHALHDEPEPACDPAADGRLRAAHPGGASCASSRPMSAAASARRSTIMPRRRSSPGPPARCGSPVKWTAERSESFMSDAHGRDHVTHVELALDADGKFTGAARSRRSPIWAPICRPSRPAIPTYLYGTLLAGTYTTPAIYVETKAVFTNTVPVDAYRGAGRPEATLPAGAHRRSRGRRARHRPGRIAPPQLHPDRRLPLPDAGRAAIRQRRLPDDAARWR